MAAALAGDNAGAWAGGDVVLGGSLPTAQAAGRGVLDTLSVAYGGSQSWALESAQFSLRRQPGPQPEGWRYTPTAPPSFNDATAAICDASSEDLLISMLRYHPALASQKNKYGVTLLHWAAYYCASDATVRALVAANADAARQASASDGCLPLHIGAAWNLSPFGLATIFAAHPGAVKELDANGLTPAEKAEQAGHSAAAALLNDREALLHALTCDDQRGRLVKAIMDKCSKQKTFKQADKLAALRLELEALELGPLRLRAIAAGVDPRRLGCAICRRPSLSPILTWTQLRVLHRTGPPTKKAGPSTAAATAGKEPATRALCEECGICKPTHAHRAEPTVGRWCVGCVRDGPGIRAAVPLPRPQHPEGEGEGEGKSSPRLVLAQACDAHPWALWCAGKGYLLRMSDHASYQRRLKEERDARLAGEKRIAQLESQVADLTKELKLTKGREKGLLRMLDKLAARDAETHVPTNEWLGDGPALAQDVRRLLQSG